MDIHVILIVCVESLDPSSSTTIAPSLHFKEEFINNALSPIHNVHFHNLSARWSSGIEMLMTCLQLKTSMDPLGAIIL